MKRALRRHHKVRLKKKRANYWGGDVEQIGPIVATPAVCSNPFCCGNPRRLKGRNQKTMQERRFTQDNHERVDSWRHDSMHYWYFND